MAFGTRGLLVMGAMFFGENVAFAQDAFEDFSDLDDLDAELSGLESGGGESSRGPSLEKFSGFIAEEIRVYPVERGLGQNDQQLLTESQLEFDLRIIGGLSLEVTPWFLIDALDTELLRYEPLEAYLIYRAENWDILAGQFIESWGIADTYNPLDGLNRRDLGVDIFGAPVRGEFGARVRWTLPSGKVLGEPTFGIYTIPVWRKTDFPTEDQRFSFSTPGSVLLTDETSGPAGVDRILNAFRFDSTLSTNVVSADVQVLASRGPERTPLIGVVPQADGRLGFVPQYYGLWTMGGGFRAVPEFDGWSKFTLKGEVAYKRSYVFSDFTGPGQVDLTVKPEDYVQFVGGVDRSFVNLFIEQDELTLTLEYAGEAGADDAATLFRPFNADLALRAHWSAGDFARSSLEMRGIIDVKNGEIIAEGVAARQLRFIHDDLKLQISGRYLRSSEQDGSVLSFFPTNNSSLSGRLQFDF